MALAGMTQEETNLENRMHCKWIAEDLEKYASGGMYKCPQCGADIEWSNDAYNDDDATYTCQECGATFDERDLEPLSVWEYFNDVYDIEYRVNSSKEYRSVRIMIACGGPNIYIDTATRSVELYWWMDRASYPISYDAVDVIDNWAEEYWRCM